MKDHQNAIDAKYIRIKTITYVIRTNTYDTYDTYDFVLSDFFRESVRICLYSYVYARIRTYSYVLRDIHGQKYVPSTHLEWDVEWEWEWEQHQDRALHESEPEQL